MCSYSNEKNVACIKKCLNTVKSGHTVVVSVFLSVCGLLSQLSTTLFCKSHLD